MLRSKPRSRLRAGKSFAVVASEIKNPANQTAKATEKQNAATIEIARNAQEAARGTKEVSTTIEGVRQAANEGGGRAGC